MISKNILYRVEIYLQAVLALMINSSFNRPLSPKVAGSIALVEFFFVVDKYDILLHYFCTEREIRETSLTNYVDQNNARQFNSVFSTLWRT